jgi:dTDP-4-dehydrorhamnose 3,5-epimerase-like enzyme
MAMHRMTAVFSYDDQRGSLTTLFNAGGWQEANYIETRANVLRGGHYHTQTREMVFMIDGEVEVTVEHLTTQARQRHMLRQGELLVIEPYDLHSFRTLTDCRWLNFLSHPFDQADPDLHHP